MAPFRSILAIFSVLCITAGCVQGRPAPVETPCWFTGTCSNGADHQSSYSLKPSTAAPDYTHYGTTISSDTSEPTKLGAESPFGAASMQTTEAPGESKQQPGSSILYITEPEKFAESELWASAMTTGGPGGSQQRPGSVEQTTVSSSTVGLTNLDVESRFGGDSMQTTEGSGGSKQLPGSTILYITEPVKFAESELWASVKTTEGPGGSKQRPGPDSSILYVVEPTEYSFDESRAP